MPDKLKSFIITHDFDVAWWCYQDWKQFEKEVNLSDAVGFSGRHVNHKNCWEVLLSQEIHQRRFAALDASRAVRPFVHSLNRAFKLVTSLAVVTGTVLVMSSCGQEGVPRQGESTPFESSNLPLSSHREAESNSRQVGSRTRSKVYQVA